MKTFNPGEHPREADGTFATKGYADVGQLELEEPEKVEEPEPEEPEPEPSLVFERITTLMGDKMLLDSERTSTPPKINADDNVHKIAMKYATYLGKNQRFDDLTDDELRERFALSPTDATLGDRFADQLGLGADSRVLYGLDERGRKTAIALTNDVKKPGSYVNGWTVDNASTVMARADMTDRMLQRGFDPKLTKRHVKNVFNKRYGGKAFESSWSESSLQLRQAAAAMAAYAAQHPGTEPDDLAKAVRSMDAAEAAALIRTLPTSTSVTGTKAYTTSINGRGFVIDESELAYMESHNNSPRVETARLNRAIRAEILEDLNLEQDFWAQRRYVRDNSGEGSARVFEQKKNVPAKYLEAAETSFFKTSGDFRHVEIDSDADLDKVAHVAAEYESLRDYLPRTTKAPSLRFRKTGRHHAIGMYHPHADNLAVDPRNPRSFLHEHAHHIDFTVEGRNISESEEYRPLLRAIQQRYDDEAENLSAAMVKKMDYLRTPTETLARSAELYYHFKGVESSLLGSEEEYAGEMYAPMHPLKDQIVAFWDEMMPKLGAKPLPNKS